MSKKYSIIALAFTQIRLTVCAVLCLTGLSLVSHTNAQTTWQYSAQGSVLDVNRNTVNISGTMVIDTTVRDWSSPDTTRTGPCECSSFLSISSFELRIGDLSLIGGGPVSQRNSLFTRTTDMFIPGSFNFGSRDWFLSENGINFTLVGTMHQSFNPDGTPMTVDQYFRESPASILLSALAFSDPNLKLANTNANLQLTLTRVAPIPEPEIYAMMLAGLGVLSFVARRRARVG